MKNISVLLYFFTWFEFCIDNINLSNVSFFNMLYLVFGEFNLWIWNYTSPMAQTSGRDWHEPRHISLVFSHLFLSCLEQPAILGNYPEDKSVFQYKNKVNCLCYEHSSIFQNIWCINTADVWSSAAEWAYTFGLIHSNLWEKIPFRCILSKWLLLLSWF